MAKRITTMELMEKMDAMLSKMESIEARLSAVEGSSKTKSSKKTSSAPKKKTSKKSSSSDTFDRALYESTAKKLGVFNAEYGKVTATVKDGKVVKTARENRQLVYKEMGIK